MRPGAAFIRGASNVATVAGEIAGGKKGLARVDASAAASALLRPGAAFIPGASDVATVAAEIAAGKKGRARVDASAAAASAQMRPGKACKPGATDGGGGGGGGGK